MEDRRGASALRRRVRPRVATPPVTPPRQGRQRRSIGPGTCCVGGCVDGCAGSTSGTLGGAWAQVRVVSSCRAFALPVMWRSLGIRASRVDGVPVLRRGRVETRTNTCFQGGRAVRIGVRIPRARPRVGIPGTHGEPLPVASCKEAVGGGTYQTPCGADRVGDVACHAVGSAPRCVPMWSRETRGGFDPERSKPVAAGSGRSSAVRWMSRGVAKAHEPRLPPVRSRRLRGRRGRTLEGQAPSRSSHEEARLGSLA
jgi:hypothetical protein